MAQGTLLTHAAKVAGTCGACVRRIGVGVWLPVQQCPILEQEPGPRVRSAQLTWCAIAHANVGLGHQARHQQGTTDGTHNLRTGQTGAVQMCEDCGCLCSKCVSIMLICLPFLVPSPVAAGYHPCAQAQC
jgi:hypothetical protein